MRTDPPMAIQADERAALNSPPPRVDIIIMDRRCCPPQATPSPLCWALMMVVETAAAAADEDDVATPDARATVATRQAAWQTTHFSIVPCCVPVFGGMGWVVEWVRACWICDGVMEARQATARGHDEGTSSHFQGHFRPALHCDSMSYTPALNLPHLHLLLFLLLGAPRGFAHARNLGTPSACALLPPPYTTSLASSSSSFTDITQRPWRPRTRPRSWRARRRPSSSVSISLSAALTM